MESKAEAQKKPDLKETADYFKHLSLFWTDMAYLISSKPSALTSAGPMRKFTMQTKKLANEMIESNEDLIEFNNRLTEYYKQLSDTWNEAQKRFNTKVPEIPNDVEQIESSKRVWIDIFENAFTQLFDSEKFGENFGKLISSELELSKHWNNMFAVLLEAANVPTKNDLNEVYQELHLLRKRVSKLEKSEKKAVVEHNGK
ncbi:MAG: hypothetical protein E6L00_02275 [Thaumarchaeota archaeon]|nr:MAG: hypothetical protein E6L00_02275 [Nitrososphaerota archaeon]